MSGIDKIKPVYPAPPRRRIDENAPRRDRGDPEQPAPRPRRDGGQDGEDKPQVDEYAEGVARC